MDSPFLEQLQSMLEQTTPFSEQHSSILEHPLLMEELAPLKQLPPSQEHLPPLYKVLVQVQVPCTTIIMYCLVEELSAVHCGTLRCSPTKLEQLFHNFCLFCPQDPIVF